jgi:hypothetical protein
MIEADLRFFDQRTSSPCINSRISRVLVHRPPARPRGNRLGCSSHVERAHHSNVLLSFGNQILDISPGIQEEMDLGRKMVSESLCPRSLTTRDLVFSLFWQLAKAELCRGLQDPLTAISLSTIDLSRIVLAGLGIVGLCFALAPPNGFIPPCP